MGSLAAKLEEEKASAPAPPPPPPKAAKKGMTERERLNEERKAAVAKKVAERAAAAEAAEAEKLEAKLAAGKATEAERAAAVRAASLASVPAGTWTESEKAWWGAKEAEEKKTGLVQTEAPFEPPPVEVEDAPAVAIVKDDDSVTVTDEEIAAVMRGGLKFLSWSETLPERRARATAVAVEKKKRVLAMKYSDSYSVG